MKILLSLFFIVYTIALVIFTILLCNYQDTCDMGFALCITGGISIMGFVIYLVISWLYGEDMD